MHVSIHDNHQVNESVATGAKTNGTVSGTAIDVSGSKAVQFLILATGAGWTDGTHHVQFFHREAAADSWVRVPTVQLDAKITAQMNDESGNGRVSVTDATLDGKVVQVGYIGGKRYVKADVVTTGATTGALLGVLVEQALMRSEGKNPMTPGF